ncbi:cytosolic sulfotransferase 3-like isoform X1 [Oncorhynchus keta]|uniref:cytosolic sulfotransferase 3-like isoform X1 n=1 Tax=Oncorhynchus keta TaxID=8018 RepID=UPI00227C77E9|nr:cytosolic sulfotransferase 3-like isoform X1 [Oncorhynchus keta]
MLCFSCPGAVLVYLLNPHPVPVSRLSMELPSRPNLFDFHGVSMIHHFTDNWENIRNFQARPDDILIATYPKAGTELADKLSTSPRLIKTHLPVQLVPNSFWEQNCRIVYVARNAKDNAVSYFHFDRMNQAQPEPGDWNNFLQRFMDGKMVFGSWYDHVTGWWERKQTHSKLHYVFYEDMVEDMRRELDRLCSFLGLSPSAEEKERVREGVQFDNMKKNSMANYSTLPIMDIKISPFMRKGRPFYFSPYAFLSASNFSLLTPSVTLQERLVTGRTISLLPRVNSLMKTIRR